MGEEQQTWPFEETRDIGAIQLRSLRLRVSVVSSGRVGLLQVVSISDAERLAVRPGLFKDISDIVLTPPCECLACWFAVMSQEHLTGQDRRLSVHFHKLRAPALPVWALLSLQRTRPRASRPVTPLRKPKMQMWWPH